MATMPHDQGAHAGDEPSQVYEPSVARRCFGRSLGIPLWAGSMPAQPSLDCKLGLPAGADVALAAPSVVYEMHSKQPLATRKAASWFGAGWCAINNKPQEAHRLTVRGSTPANTHSQTPIANSTVSRVDGWVDWATDLNMPLACWRLPFPPKAKAAGRLKCRAAPPASLATGIDAGSPLVRPSPQRLEQAG